MNENINLCELLEGHEGKTFYSPICGDIVFCEINLLLDNPIVTNRFCLSQGGKWNSTGECMLFPSKDQRDWNKWAKEQKPKVSKTWDENIKITNAEVWNAIATLDYGSTTPIIRSILAFLKIHQLIEVGYGGNITNDEWRDCNRIKYAVNRDCYNINPECVLTTHSYSHIAFHTEQQRDEFLSYPENVQLLKDFYML